VFAAEEGPLAGIPTSINGNVGLNGGGYGDVYGGKIKEGVYGAGGRVGGNVNLVGTAGLRRKRGITVNGSGASSGAIASGPDSFSMAGAASGSGSISFGNWAPRVAPVAPAVTTAAPAPAP
ncbi:hypothetical protein PFISCL1PPCAC_28211, partial [Pristionchus fissidentatus]